MDLSLADLGPRMSELFNRLVGQQSALASPPERTARPGAVACRSGSRAGPRVVRVLLFPWRTIRLYGDARPACSPSRLPYSSPLLTDPPRRSPTPASRQGLAAAMSWMPSGTPRRRGGAWQCGPGAAVTFRHGARLAAGEVVTLRGLVRSVNGPGVATDTRARLDPRGTAVLAATARARCPELAARRHGADGRRGQRLARRRLHARRRPMAAAPDDPILDPGRSGASAASTSIWPSG